MILSFDCGTDLSEETIRTEYRSIYSALKMRPCVGVNVDELSKVDKKILWEIAKISVLVRIVRRSRQICDRVLDQIMMKELGDGLPENTSGCQERLWNIHCYMEKGLEIICRSGEEY